MFNPDKPRTVPRGARLNRFIKKPTTFHILEWLWRLAKIEYDMSGGKIDGLAVTLFNQFDEAVDRAWGVVNDANKDAERALKAQDLTRDSQVGEALYESVRVRYEQEHQVELHWDEMKAFWKVMIDASASARVIASNTGVKLDSEEGQKEFAKDQLSYVQQHGGIPQLEF